MKVQGLLVAVGALALLSGAVYWSNKAEEAKKDQPDPDAPPKILELDKETISKVAVRKTDDEALVLEKGDDGDWKLTAPRALRADQDSVGSLLSTVSSLSSNRLVEEEAGSLSDYGLDTPTLEVEITDQDGQPKKLVLGDETPTGANYFAKLDGDPRVFTLASFNKTSLEKTPWDLRDKRLLTFDSDKLTRVELTAKGQTVEVGKNNENEWQIVKPRPLRADGGNVEQLMSRLRDAKMDSEMSDDDLKEAASTFAKSSRVAVARVTDAAGTQEIEIRKTKDDDFYAKSSVVEGVHKVTSTVGEGLDKGLGDLRNKKLFDFSWSDPTRIEIRDGDAAAVYEKSEDKWLRDGVQMDSVSVRALIDELRDLSAAEFPDKGFTEPVFEAKVTSDEGKRVEKVLISKSGEDSYFAKRENEPSIYELDAADVEDLLDAARDVKEPEEPKDEEGEESEEEGS